MSIHHYSVKMKIKSTIWIVILILAFFPKANSQSLTESITFKQEAEQKFLETMRLFRAARFDTASSAFVNIIKEYPRSHRTTGAYIMGGKAYYEVGKYRESIHLLKDLVDVFPQSTYIDDAHYSLGLNYYRLERYEDAASEFITVVQISQKPKLLERSRKLAEMITSSYLSLMELKVLRLDTKTDEMSALVDLKTAEKLQREGDFTSANELLNKVALMPPNIKYVADALRILEKTAKEGGIKIGLVLPLMVKEENPSARVLGMEFLQGIQLAIDEFNQLSPVKIVLEIRDTERDPSIAARHVADLCSDESVSIIVGPVISSEVFAAAGIANERGVPLITPTATANGIAAIGPFIFQANPDYDIRGRAIAAYAHNELGARNFAVLAPADMVGKQIAESFVAQVDSLCGEVIDVEWYTPGSTNLRTEMTTLRRKAFAKLEVPTVDFGAKMKQAVLNRIKDWGVEERILDSLIERKLKAPVTFLFGKRGKIIADSLKIETQIEKFKYDSLEFPVTNIDGIFIPITNPEEIAVVSSQLKYFNINALILGTGDWNDQDALYQSQQYTDKAIFTVDSYTDVKSDEYKIFAVNLKLANNNKMPSINSLIAYDVAKLVTHVLSQGKTKRVDVAESLSKVQDFSGLHSKISLSLNRVNSYLLIMQYKNRQILKIGEIDLANQGK